MGSFPRFASPTTLNKHKGRCSSPCTIHYHSVQSSAQQWCRCQKRVPPRRCPSQCCSGGRAPGSYWSCRSPAHGNCRWWGRISSETPSLVGPVAGSSFTSHPCKKSVKDTRGPLSHRTHLANPAFAASGLQVWRCARAVKAGCLTHVICGVAAPAGPWAVAGGAGHLGTGERAQVCKQILRSGFCVPCHG